MTGNESSTCTSFVNHHMDTMKFRLLILFALVFSPSHLPAQNSLLWKITSPSGAVSHIFGTIHLQDSTVFRMRDTVLALVRTCSVYASEMELDSAAAMMTPSVLFLSNATLYDVLDSAQVGKVCSVLNERMPGTSILCPQMKPGAIGMLVSFASKKQTAPIAMDQLLWNLAKEHSPRMVGLETLSEQIAVIDRMTADMLLEHINNLASEDSLATLMPLLYVQEDLTALALMSQDTTEAYSGMQEILNDDRNVKMVSRMDAMLQEGNAFIAIVALHLTGEKSVLRLLRQQGYKVEPVLGGTRSQWVTTGTK